VENTGKRVANRALDQAVLQYIVQDKLPFNTVGGKGFTHLCEQLSAYKGPIYAAPSRRKISSLLDKMFASQCEEVIQNQRRIITKYNNN
jgi:hypothetical protein